MGQLGSASSLAAIVTPVATTGLSADSYPSISAGYNHTCVVPGSTAPKCWGNNAYGQLGNGTQVTSSSPVLLPPLSGTTKIAAGNRFSCALHSTGAVKCWGINDYGQIGDTTVFDKYVPTSVSGVASATSIATGFAHACAIIGSGASSTVKCWGNNSYGQVGNGASGTLVTTPVAVTSLTGATALALGSYHSCALLTTGAVKCWGLNTSGQLGNTTSTNSSSPVQVSGLTSGVSEISVGSYYTCAALSAGGIKCWGDNFSGGFGDGSRTASLVPVAGSNNVSGVFLYLSLGQSHTCGFYNANGYPFCWGNNYNGQLGNGTDILPLYGPIYSVSGIGVGTVSKMTAGSAHTCAVVSNIVKCWGQNTSGELGNGATLNAFSTVPINISWP
jgi:alpha-tubulin suppressor-like RCC1 family protein